MDLQNIITVSVLGGAWLLLFVLVLVALVQLARLRRRVQDMQATGRIRVQKLKINKDKNHAFHNPALSPDEELAQRGYTMYVGDDVETGPSRSRYTSEVETHSSRGRERQTGGQLVDELQREIDQRQQRASTAPPFLLQAIQHNKRASRGLDPGGRHSETNPNFIY